MICLPETCFVFFTCISSVCCTWILFVFFFCFVLFFCFFQAEDGIRDLVRSRGLGDVYKRQDLNCNQTWQGRGAQAAMWICIRLRAMMIPETPPNIRSVLVLSLIHI